MSPAFLFRGEVTPGTDAGVIADEIGKKLGIKLKAKTPTDTVDGYVTVDSRGITICTYDSDEGPTPAHMTTFRRKRVSPPELKSASGVVRRYFQRGKYKLE